MAGSAVSHGSDSKTGISRGTDPRERRGRGEPHGRRGRVLRGVPGGSPRPVVCGAGGLRGETPRVCRWRGGGAGAGPARGRRGRGWHGSAAPLPAGLGGSAGRGGRCLRPQPSAPLPSTALKSARRRRLPAPSSLLGAVHGSRWIPTPRSGCCFLKPPACIPPSRAFQGRCSPEGAEAFPRRWCHPSRAGCAFTIPPQTVPNVSVCLRGRGSCSRHLAAFLNADPLRFFKKNLLLKQHLGSVHNYMVKRHG